MCSLLADVVCLGHNLPWQLFLDSQTPRLFVWNVVADRGNWTKGTKSDVVRSPQRVAHRQLGACARKWIAQPGPGQDSVVVEGGNPLRLLIEALITPGAGSSRARAGLLEEDTVSATDHKVMLQLPGKSESRLNRLVVSIVVVAVAGAGEYLASVQCRQAWYLEGRHDSGIQPVHAVEAFRPRQ